MAKPLSEVDIHHLSMQGISTMIVGNKEGGREPPSFLRFIGHPFHSTVRRNVALCVELVASST